MRRVSAVDTARADFGGVAPLTTHAFRSLLYSKRVGYCHADADYYAAFGCPHAGCACVAPMCAAISEHARTEHALCSPDCTACADYAPPIPPPRRKGQDRRAACTHPACAYIPCMAAHNHAQLLQRHEHGQMGHTINAMLVAGGLVPQSPRGQLAPENAIVVSRIIYNRIRSTSKAHSINEFRACSQVTAHLFFPSAAALAFALGLQTSAIVVVPVDEGILRAIAVDMTCCRPNTSPRYAALAKSDVMREDAVITELRRKAPHAIIAAMYQRRSAKNPPKLLTKPKARVAAPAKPPVRTSARAAARLAGNKRAADRMSDSDSASERAYRRPQKRQRLQTRDIESAEPPASAFARVPAASADAASDGESQSSAECTQADTRAPVVDALAQLFGLNMREVSRGSSPTSEWNSDSLLM